MENFIIYIAKASLLVALFFLAYHFLLRKETFFTSNRWFLLAGLFTSVVLPLIAYTKIIWVDPPPQYPAGTLGLEHYAALQQAIKSASAPAANPINWFDVAAGIYFAGVLLFFGRFVYDIISLRKLLKGQQIVKLGRYYMVDTPAVQHPFSFFNYIVYNSAVLEPYELESIISHEKVHSRQRHSLDMVTGQLFCIAFWFNPLVWKYKNSISQNLEFIADSIASKQISDARIYQKTMLKFTVQPQYIAITNHFYQSLIKKRIVMLNKQKSKKMNLFKYGIMLPVLAGFMLLFQVKTLAQEKKTESSVVESKFKFAVAINKDLKDEELKEGTKLFKEEFDTDVDFQNVKRNDKNEITAVKVTLKDKTQSQAYEVAGTGPIAPFTIEVEKDDKGKNTFAFGNGNKDRFIKAKNFTIVNDARKGDTVFKDSKTIIRGNGIMGSTPPPPPAFNDSDISKGHWSVNSMKFGDTDALVVINGVKQKKGAEIKLPLNQEIAEINVLKNKEAKKKYGKDGKNGVVEIITRKELPLRMGRLGNLNGDGHSYAITIPEGDVEFGFDMDGLGGMMRMGDMEEVQKLLGEMHGSFNFESYFNDDDMKKLMEQLRKGEAEFKDRLPELEKELKKSLSGDDYKDALEEAKKGMEEARKEMEQARKDLEKTRKQLNRKA